MHLHPLSIHRLTVVLVLGAACAPADAPDDAPADPTVTPAATSAGPAPLRASAGTLRLEEGVLRFAACGASGHGSAVDDGSNGDAPAIVTELGPDHGVTALVTIEDNRLLAVHYAAPEGASCDDLPPEAGLEARGQEPFWFVSLSGDVATVRTPDELDGVAYTGGHWSTSDATHWRYDASRGEEALVLALVEERCVDAMSGARYPLRATLTRGGESMSGCAVQARSGTP